MEVVGDAYADLRLRGPALADGHPRGESQRVPASRDASHSGAAIIAGDGMGGSIGNWGTGLCISRSYDPLHINVCIEAQANLGASNRVRASWPLPGI